VVPQELKKSLARLYQPGAVMLNQPGGGEGEWFRPAFRMGWGHGAEEVWDDYRRSIEREADDRKRELCWRSAEKAVRIATNVAAGCFAQVVTRDHMEWARRWMMQSDETLLTGVEEYMEEEKYAFGELCREIVKRVGRAGGRMTHRQIGRSFQGHLTYARDLESALNFLTGTAQLVWGKDPTGGRPTEWYALPEKE
jgi:hypothetical protein